MLEGLLVWVEGGGFRLLDQVKGLRCRCLGLRRRV